MENDKSQMTVTEALAQSDCNIIEKYAFVCVLVYLINHNVIVSPKWYITVYQSPTQVLVMEQCATRNVLLHRFVMSLCNNDTQISITIIGYPVHHKKYYNKTVRLNDPEIFEADMQHVIADMKRKW